MILAYVLVTAGALAAALVQLPTAAAHTCSSNNHGGCDAHSCAERGTHLHRTEHWYGDHWCRSEASAVVYGPVDDPARLDPVPVAML